jgi:hypothetical protein
MKTTNLKFIAIAFSALMLMQSCTVYEKNLSSTDEALLSKKNKRLVTKGGNIYHINDKINNLKKEDNNIILATKKDSKIAIDFSSYISNMNLTNDYVRVKIPLEKISGFYLKDVKSSTIVTVIAIIIPIATVVGLVAHDLNNHFFE